MKVAISNLAQSSRTDAIKSALDKGDRLGLISSIDGDQLITLLLSSEDGTANCFETAVDGKQYKSITPEVTAAHWFERTTYDMFDLYPKSHPRLKRTHLHEQFAQIVTPLSKSPTCALDKHAYEFLSVEGDGVYEIPVGPIHAGIIEPGHFRFSCFGEQIVNLEIRLGYLHRGIEKRLTEIPWQRARVLVETAASDMPVANALAHVTALESLLTVEVSRSSLLLRTIALETERIAMHISDLGGIAGDIGFLAISSSLSQIRGLALRMGEILSGNRLMRGLITPGGVAKHLSVQRAAELITLCSQLRKQSRQTIEFFLDDQVARDRMEGVGVVSSSLAQEFGIVGIAGRASGINYDCRTTFKHGLYPEVAPPVACASTGDVAARVQVRVSEIETSLNVIESLLSEHSQNSETHAAVEAKHSLVLAQNATAIGIVESHRGELIHFIHTDDEGKIMRYCIKDPSVNNWTALAIAVRNNLVSDFPLCNKSFNLSYGGHDL